MSSLVQQWRRVIQTAKLRGGDNDKPRLIVRPSWRRMRRYYKEALLKPDTLDTRVSTCSVVSTTEQLSTTRRHKRTTSHRRYKIYSFAKQRSPRKTRGTRSMFYSFATHSVAKKSAESGTRSSLFLCNAQRCKAVLFTRNKSSLL